METVEESGAGDAFTAGLIKGILRNWKLDDALGLASVVGASCTRAPGCYASIFTFDQAVAFLRNQQTASLSRFQTG
jgi:sugar/nucleoside kinase (ribokinase family)